MQPEHYIRRLSNAIQNYAWGSRYAIAALLGEKVPSDQPQAELWMGAHPKASSQVEIDDRRISMLEWIETDPAGTLGPAVARKYGRRLPFLFKVLAAGQPLSIQAHPNRRQAQEGFARENQLKLALDDPRRCYKDENAKPEIICALSPFWALKGFRKIEEIRRLLSAVWPPTAAALLFDLHHQPASKGLRQFLTALLRLTPAARRRLIQGALPAIRGLGDQNDIYRWMVKLHQHYPDDVGLFYPGLLHLIRLDPGQALFLPAGELHSYLDGTGIELMGNSDNVLRGGLTGKHIDVAELLHIATFAHSPAERLKPRQLGASQWVYDTPSNTFVLSRIEVEPQVPYRSSSAHSIAILLCTEGQATIKARPGQALIKLAQGQSVVVPASVGAYQLQGSATLFKAAVPPENIPC